MQTSDKGKCRKCGKLREEANHKKCDAWLARMAARGGWVHIANNEGTTGDDLRRLAEAIGKDKPIGFKLQLVWWEAK